MARKAKYINEKDIQAIENIIYNDLCLPSYLNDTYPDIPIDENSLKKLLKKGEKYIILKGDFDGIMVTSLGRIINTETWRQYLIVSFLTSAIKLYIRGKIINLEEVFENNGWKYSTAQINKNYLKYKWKRQDFRNKSKI